MIARPADLRGLILDLDGLLIDSEMWSWQAHNQALAAANAAPLSLEEVRRLVGLAPEHEWAALVEMRALPGPSAAYAFAQREAFLALRDRSLAPLPGVRELLRTATDQGLLLAVASNSPLPSVTAALMGIGVRQYFTAVCSADEVPHGKPAPDVYQLALDRLALRPTQAIAVEDSAYGLAAARAAELICFVVPSELTLGQDLGSASERFASLLDITTWLATGRP